MLPLAVAGVAYLYLAVVVLPSVRSGLVKPPKLPAGASAWQVLRAWAAVVTTALFLSPWLSAKKHQRAPRLPTHAVTNRELLRIARTAHVMSPTPVELLESDSSDDEGEGDDEDSVGERGTGARIAWRPAARPNDGEAAASPAMMGPRGLARIKSAPALIEKHREAAAARPPAVLMAPPVAWAAPALGKPMQWAAAPLTCRARPVAQPKDGRPAAARRSSRSPPRPGGRLMRRRKLTVVLDLDECLVHSTFHAPEPATAVDGRASAAKAAASMQGGAARAAAVKLAVGDATAAAAAASGGCCDDGRAGGGNGSSSCSNASSAATDKYRQAEERPASVAAAADCFRVTLEDGDSATVNCRPGLAPFLEELAASFHTVVFTAGCEAYAKPVLDALDPEGRLFHQRLYRTACHEARGGVFLKDLASVGRLAAAGGGGSCCDCFAGEAAPLPAVGAHSRRATIGGGGAACSNAGGSSGSSSGSGPPDVLGRTVLVDNSPFSLLLQPANGILVSSYFDDASDNALPSVLQLLRHLDALDDVRPALADLFCLGPVLQEYRAFVLQADSSEGEDAGDASVAGGAKASSSGGGSGSVNNDLNSGSGPGKGGG